MTKLISVLAALPLLAACGSAYGGAASPEAGDAQTIRSYGFSLGGVLEQWQEAYAKEHPDIVFENTLPTSDAAIPALATNLSDLGPNGGEPSITEALVFYETHGYAPDYVVVASGSYAIEGRSNGPVIFVNERNPLEKLTIDQLDGIFGSERSGGLRGFEWTEKDARGAKGNIRTWRELGVTGQCADKPIQTYGHGPSGTTRFFQLHVLAGSDKWNPNYRGYVETGSKQIPTDEREQSRLGAKHMLGKELAKDPCGIAWSVMSQAEGIEGIKPIAIAPRGTTNYVTASEDTFQDRSYPLVRNIYVYFDRKPGEPLDPKLKSFLNFALSEEGQKMVADAGYLPLPDNLLREQRNKLD